MQTILKIIRPVNLLIAGITCVVFRIIAAGEIGEWIPFLAYVSGVVCIMIGGYLINDYVDFKTDAINKPYKTHFTNKKTYINLAVIFYALAFILGLYTATFKGYSSTSFVFGIALFLLFLYSVVLQYLPLIGNFTIGFLAVILYIPLYEGVILTPTVSGVYRIIVYYYPCSRIGKRFGRQKRRRSSTIQNVSYSCRSYCFKSIIDCLLCYFYECTFQYILGSNYYFSVNGFIH